MGRVRGPKDLPKVVKNNSAVKVKEKVEETSYQGIDDYLTDDVDLLGVAKEKKAVVVQDYEFEG